MKRKQKKVKRDRHTNRLERPVMYGGKERRAVVDERSGGWGVAGSRRVRKARVVAGGGNVTMEISTIKGWGGGLTSKEIRGAEGKESKGFGTNGSVSNPEGSVDRRSQEREKDQWGVEKIGRAVLPDMQGGGNDRKGNADIDEKTNDLENPCKQWDALSRKTNSTKR